MQHLKLHVPVITMSVNDNIKFFENTIKNNNFMEQR